MRIKAIAISLIGMFMAATLAAGLSGTVSAASSVQSQNLIAGQNTVVGVVEVWNDNDYLYVKYRITDENWCLTEVHLSIVTGSWTDIPQTKTHNPIPGQFEYKADLACVSEYTFQISLSEKDWTVGTILFIAAHAVVMNDYTCGSETAWGQGTRFNTKGNWGMWFNYTIQTCDEEVQGTYTIGYWKTHAGFGPQDDVVTALLPIWLGTENGAKSVEVTTAAQAVSIFDNAGGQNKINMLYAQELAAKLNIANGADGSAIASTITAADAFLATHNAGDWNSLSSSQKADVTSWANIFDQYNNGVIGPGHA